MFGKVNEDSLQTLFPTLGNFSRSNSEISDQLQQSNEQFSLRSPKLTSNGLTRLDFSLTHLREEFLSSNEQSNNINKRTNPSAISPPGFNLNSDFSSLLNSLDRDSKTSSPLSPITNTFGSLQQQQQQQQQQQLAKTNTSRYKTELCRPYQENGTCKYGDKCQFAHGKPELRSVSRHPKYKTDLCRTYHSVGFCPYGPRCHFIHNLDEGKPNEKAPGQSNNGAQGNAVNANGQALNNGMPPLPMFSNRDYASDGGSVSNSPSSSSSSSSSDFDSESEKGASPFMSPSRLPVFSTLSK